MIRPASGAKRAGLGHDMLPRVQLLSAIFWPSFVFAGIAAAVFFSVFDPVRILGCEAAPPLGRTAAYSIGFFAFWALTVCVAMATTYYLRPVDQVPGEPTIHP